MNPPPTARSAAVLHRARFLLPVSRPPVEDGAVVAANGVIVAAGPYKELRDAAPSGVERRDHGDAALMPALVNAHTHLELTDLERRMHLPQPDFPSWLRELFRARADSSPEEVKRALPLGKEKLRGAGVALYGDIGNGDAMETALGGRSQKPEQHVFLELLGFDRESLVEAAPPEAWRVLRRAAAEKASWSLAAHACYSVSPAVIQKAKEWCRLKGRPFSMHTAEHPEEIEFLQTGGGYCRELLESLGKWVPGWRAPGLTPVEYLDCLKVLDSKTLLVHAVHMTEADWDRVARRRCPVCFCPRSNANIGAGTPFPSQAFRRGIPSALGTDSLASNTDLDLFAEGTWLLDHDPSVPPQAVLSMLTLGGAIALGREQAYGSLEPGKQAAMLSVSLPASRSHSDWIETVLYQGKEGDRQWA